MMQKDVAIELQEKNLDILIRNEGFEFTDTFKPYTSGEIGPYYVQSGDVQNNGHDLATAVSNMAFMIEQTIGKTELSINDKSYVISGGETRDWIFSLPVATQLKLSHTMIYKDGKTVGANMDKKKVVHIADLNNEGSSPRDYWIPIIWQANGKINDIFFYVDRMENGVEEMQKLGLQSHALVPLNEHAWNYLQKRGVVNEETYKNLRERGTTKESRDAWAIKMLKSDRGFQTLANLLDDDNEKIRNKGWKILDKGYPKIKQEILERFKQAGYEFRR